MNERVSWRDFDWALLLLSVSIAIVGVLEIYSAARSTPWQDAYLKQIVWLAFGVALLWVCSTVDYHWLVQQSPAFLGASVIGLLAVLAFGPVINGSRRWLTLPGLPNFQVSEFVKVVLVLLVARLFAELPRGRLTAEHAARAAAAFAIPLLLVARQPDLSTALTYLPIFGIGILLAGLNWRVVAIGALAAALLAPILWYTLEPYQRERVTAFLEPEKDPRGAGYQSLQSKIAVGAGGVWGQGFARGSQTQLRFLPEAHTDFVFASYAEESGFVGVAILLSLYFAMLMKIVSNAQTAADAAGMLICMAVAAILLFHVTVNIGMVVNKMPVTGIPLPLMSYGGSNMLTTFMLLGLVNNVRLRRFAN